MYVSGAAEGENGTRDRKTRGDGWIRVVEGDAKALLHLCIPQRTIHECVFVRFERACRIIGL